MGMKIEVQQLLQEIRQIIGSDTICHRGNWCGCWRCNYGDFSSSPRISLKKLQTVHSYLHRSFFETLINNVAKIQISPNWRALMQARIWKIISIGYYFIINAVNVCILNL